MRKTFLIPCLLFFSCSQDDSYKESVLNDTIQIVRALNESTQDYILERAASSGNESDSLALINFINTSDDIRNYNFIDSKMKLEQIEMSKNLLDDFDSQVDHVIYANQDYLKSSSKYDSLMVVLGQEKLIAFIGDYCKSITGLNGPWRFGTPLCSFDVDYDSSSNVLGVIYAPWPGGKELFTSVSISAFKNKSSVPMDFDYLKVNRAAYLKIPISEGQYYRPIYFTALYEFNDSIKTPFVLDLMHYLHEVKGWEPKYDPSRDRSQLKQQFWKDKNKLESQMRNRMANP